MEIHPQAKAAARAFVARWGDGADTRAIVDDWTEIIDEKVADVLGDYPIDTTGDAVINA